MYILCGKRLFDIFATLIGFIFLLPIFFIIIIWIKFSSEGPLFFTQKRVGKRFIEFNLYKFRTMIVNANTQGPSVTREDDSRITKIGKLLRRTKIDELPQLLNVLKGDMSLVGPRPEVMKFVNMKQEEYRKILSVQPGITDNAAISFRNEEKMLQSYKDVEKAYVDIILPEKIKLYHNYIDNISFSSDIKLILKTIKSI
ncbi:MAG: sugar transferase [Sulfurimonas sp.]|nr:MAG: sugar transferase [Sulfurimonas sp.]